jgi:hypothetical protein
MGAAQGLASRDGTPRHRTAAVFWTSVAVLAMTACSNSAVSARPSASAGPPDASVIAAHSVPAIDGSDVGSIVSGLEGVTGLAFAPATVSADLEAVGVQQKFVAANDAVRIGLLVLDEPRLAPEDEETLLAGTDVGGTTETTPYANHGRLFLAWQVDGDFPPLTALDEDFLSPVDRILEQVPLTADFGD